MGGVESVGAIVARFGLETIIGRHVPHEAHGPPVWGVCHACVCEMDLAPYLRPEEEPLREMLDAIDEAVAIRAWNRLLDEEPWLCASCRMLLP